MRKMVGSASLHPPCILYNVTSMEKVRRLMKQAVQDNVFPGGVLLVSKNDLIIFFEAFGYADIFSKRPVKRDTIFDLASLTKPLATTLAVIKLVQQSRLDIDQHLESVLPQFRNTEKGGIKIRHLLGHNSGLPDHRPYYEQLHKLAPDIRKAALRGFLVKESLIYPIGEKVLYSDLGFMILGWIVEAVSGKHLDHFMDEKIYRPLGLENLFFVETHPFKKESVFGRASPLEFAATEFCPWRNVLLNGAVHDDNAYTVGGIEGHAGLFGAASDVCVLLSELLATFHGYFSTCIFQRNILKEFFKRQEGTDRALGFDTPSLHDSSSGSYFSKRSVGHLGFTGTSFWMDLDLSVIVILLTNRVHPSRDNIKIKAFRPKLHDAIMKNVANTVSKATYP